MFLSFYIFGEKNPRVYVDNEAKVGLLWRLCVDDTRICAFRIAPPVSLFVFPFYFFPFLTPPEKFHLPRRHVPTKSVRRQGENVGIAREEGVLS